MPGIRKTPAGNWRASWREPSGAQASKTFATRREASAFLARMNTTKSTGAYVSPHAGRVLFGDHAREWMKTWNTEATTTARDDSVMRNHVLAKWGTWQLARIDHLSVQGWITDLGARLSPATLVQCRRLMSGVMRSALRNRLIAFNPCEGVRIPSRRTQDTDEQIIDRAVFRSSLLPVVPDRYRALVAVGGGAGLRWGETAGLCADALDLDAARLRVIRTVIEVSGHTSFKPFPKTTAGRRTVPLPGWLVVLLREHIATHPRGEAGLIFANQVGGAYRRTLFRTRVWRPALVRAGLLGLVEPDGEKFRAEWTDAAGVPGSAMFKREPAAVLHVARNQTGGLRFHDLRHSYATWLVDDGVPVNMVQRVLGHERSSTTLDLYTRRTDDPSRVLQALDDDPDDDDPDDGLAGALVPR
ncbi:MAG: site-specific integrase [Pseudonocardia sp.]|uniref:tyrosine-type recombinase/integrase n=1 Tax=Pseudonocardia sp. TaxID=60912 RepID=UPI001ACD96BB|nr:site-specific integrase [Pseudonocardia sp.]MBN9096864.1 site-specific integrase [Pseudonocardia sp.]